VPPSARILGGDHSQLRAGDGANDTPKGSTWPLLGKGLRARSPVLQEQGAALLRSGLDAQPVPGALELAHAAAAGYLFAAAALSGRVLLALQLPGASEVGAPSSSHTACTGEHPAPNPKAAAHLTRTAAASCPSQACRSASRARISSSRAGRAQQRGGRSVFISVMPTRHRASRGSHERQCISFAQCCSPTRQSRQGLRLGLALGQPSARRAGWGPRPAKAAGGRVVT
jgi:hypothetical protein